MTELSVLTYAFHTRKTTVHAGGIVFLLALAALIPAQAKDEVRLSYPSKVEAAKGKEREKLFTPWMTSEAFFAQTVEKQRKGEQLIYFEYNSSTAQSRAIFSSKLKLNGTFTHWTLTSDQAMEEKLNSEIKGGFQPVFVVRNISGAYTLMFVSPQDLDAVRKELAQLGIGEPRLKK